MNFLSRRNILVALIVILLGILAYGIVLSGRPIREVVRIPGQPAPTTNLTPTPEANITITSPTPGESISSPVRVAGQARVFENTLQVRVKDAQGRVLVQRTVMAESPDIGQFGPYEAELVFQRPLTPEGVVEAFQFSAKDGSEIDTVSVPVVFENSQTQTVQVFFGNSRLDPQGCERVFPANRTIPRTPAVGRAALEELLNGPTSTERAQGFFTSLPNSVRVQSLTIENGVARVDFNQALEQGVGGSCRVAAIRSQITQTLRQFPTVENVVITINRREEGILQP